MKINYVRTLRMKRFDKCLLILYNLYFPSIVINKWLTDVIIFLLSIGHYVKC